jgi:hypothetical protein
LQWSYGDKGGIADHNLSQAILTHPMLPVHDIGGGWAHFIPNAFVDNPVASRVIGKDDKSQSWETFGNVYAEVDLLKNFTIRTSFGGNINNYLSNRFGYSTYQPLIVNSSLANNSSDSLTNNSFTEVSGYHRSWTWTNTSKFSKTLKSDHHISALIGTEAINNYFKESVAEALVFILMIRISGCFLTVYLMQSIVMQVLLHYLHLSARLIMDSKKNIS